MTSDIQTLTKEKIKLDEPGMYDVIFLNDNITTMEFVVKVLKQIFGKTPEQAQNITTKIHQDGQVIQMDSVNFSGWKMGQVLGFDWTKVRHGTSNFGNHDRPMLCVTGTDTEKWHQLWNASTVTQIDI